MRATVQKIRVDTVSVVVAGVVTMGQLVRHIDPPIDIWCVVLEQDGDSPVTSGEWRETFGTRELARAFLRGVQAGLSTKHQDYSFAEPEIP